MFPSSGITRFRLVTPAYKAGALPTELYPVWNYSLSLMGLNGLKPSTLAYQVRSPKAEL